MSKRAEALLAQALELPSTERARLALELLESIDGSADDDADETWASEIERRAERALAGESRATDWELVRARIDSKLSDPQ